MPRVLPESYGSSGEHWKRERDVVLLADDEPPMRRIIAMCLVKGGYSVLEATSGHSALEILHLHEIPIRLLLTDLWMPDMDGISLIRETRQFESSLPILAMTGMGTHRGLDQLLLNFGVAGLLLKPFSPVQLLGFVHEAIEERTHGYHCCGGTLQAH